MFSNHFLFPGHAVSIFMLSFLLLAHVTAQEEKPATHTPSLKNMPFFRQAVGSWNGSGGSQVAGRQDQLPVKDNWRAGFVENQGQALFVQEGKVELGNGNAFTYRWIYRIDLQRKVIIAQFNNSKGDKGVSLVKLNSDGTRISVGPTDPSVKQGMFTDVWFDEKGRYTYQSQVRNESGNPFIQTKVVCERAPVAPATNVE